MRQIGKIILGITRNFTSNGCRVLQNENLNRNWTLAYHVAHRRICPCLTQLPFTVAVREFNKNNGKRCPPNDVLQKQIKKKIIKEAIDKQKKIKRDVEVAIQERKLQLKQTEKKIRAKGKMIMKDIKETKEKMRERMEEVIERENVYTIPNLLCVTRIVCSPLLGYLIVVEKFEYALVFMAIAGFSDWVDGWLARNFKSQSSKLGSFLDPMADKVLIGTLFLSLTYVDLIPIALTSLIIIRDAILVTAGFVIRYQSLPPPKTLSRYFDVTHATAQLAPTFISKVNTGIQLLVVGSTLAAPVFGYVDHPALHALWYITAVSTVLSAASYVLQKKTYRYLRSKDKSK